MKKLLFFTGIGLLLLATGCKKKGTEQLAGAGATFPLPYYNLAFENFQTTTGNAVSYGGVGSGGGIRSLKEGVVDFAGSDAFLSDKEASEMKEVIHVPTCLGAVVLSYNLPNVKNLNLTGDIVADIYLGTITKWNDPRIQAINKEIALPNKNITPVYRSDGSGTTFVFSDYLTKVSPVWSEKLGTGKSLNFATGIAAKGNPGVAGTVSQTEGAIGYIGSEYAFAQGIAIAALQNSNNEFILPSGKSISTAAAGELPADTRAMITNSPAKGAYPISCFTWILVYKEQAYSKRTIGQAKVTIDLLNYMLSDAAQNMTEKVHYAPLPKNLIEMSKKNIGKITYEGKKL